MGRHYARCNCFFLFGVFILRSVLGILMLRILSFAPSLVTLSMFFLEVIGLIFHW